MAGSFDFLQDHHSSREDAFDLPEEGLMPKA
jgi:hypothetical protein